MENIKDTLRANIRKVMLAKNFMILMSVLQTIFSALYFFNARNNRQAVINSYQQRIDSLKSITEHYQRETFFYKQKEIILNKDLSASDSLLKLERKKVVTQRNSVNILIHRDWKNLDTASKLQRCDSLREQVVIMQKEQTIADSLTDKKISSLVRLDSLKDNQIKICDENFWSMQNTLQKSISDTKESEKKWMALDDELKKVRRRSRVTRVCAFGLSVLISGAIIENYLTR